MARVIPVNEPLLDGNEKRYLLECIETGWISSEGPFVAEFERRFAAKVRRRHAIAVSNGTGALDIAIEAAGIGPCDEVIMPAFTIISCMHQILRSGAVPVLVDSDPNTWNMNVDQVAEKITAKTKAILAVHIYGLPVDMDPLLALARQHSLVVIEDAAEMHGQSYKGAPCGSFGDISTFSFYPNKHVTTGEGGMIVTDDDHLAEQCRSLRNLCFQPERRFVHERLGWNYRMTNLQAAIGLAQLERLDEFVSRKRRMGTLYQMMLGDIDGIQLPLRKTDFADNIYWVFGIVIGAEKDMLAETAIRRMMGEGVECRPFFYPMHLQPVLRRLGMFADERYPVAEGLYERGFYIPSGIAIADEQITAAAAAVRRVVS